MHKVQITPLLGIPQFDGWAQVVTSADHQLVWALGVHGQNAGNVGCDVVAALLGQPITTPAHFHQLITDLLQEVRDKDCQLQLVGGWLTGETSFFAAVQGSIVLKRGDKTGVLLRSHGELKLIQGKHTPDDVLVLATAQADTFVGEVHQKLSQGYDADTIITTLVASVHSQPDSALTALAFVTPASEEPDLELGEGEESSFPHVEFDSSQSSQEKLQDSPLSLASPPPSQSLPTSTPIAPILPAPPVLTADTHTQPVMRSAPKIVTQLNSMSKQLAGRLGEWRSWRPWSHDVYVTKRSQRQLARLAVPIVVVLVVVGGGIGIYWSRLSQQRQAATQALTPILQQLEAAKQVVGSNPVAAREQVAQAVSDLETLHTSFAGQAAGQRQIAAQLEIARQTLADISGKEEQQNLKIFYDLNWAEPNMVGSLAQVSKPAGSTGLKGIFVDTGTKHVVVLDLATQQYSELTLAGSDQVVDLAVDEDSLWWLGNGVRRMPLVGTASATVIKEEGDSNRAATLMGLFNSYLYLFNPEKRNIYRYAPNGDTYSDPIGWLVSSQGLDFSQVSSLAIDGDLWLGGKDGQLKKFTKGQPAEFTLTGMSDAFSTPIIVYTRDDLQNLYVLEPAHHRLVILSKSGEFLREIKSTSLAASTALIVDETLKKALPVNGSIVFEIEL